MFVLISAANGERVGGCPSPVEVTGPKSACQRDSDCTNLVQKCCLEQNSGVTVCANPIPGK